MLKLLSLFDGSGGFCLAAINAGIKPVAASEIEPFPIRVTTKRLPQVKHLGDVRKIDGGKIEPVDIVTFGSPCTNLSIAGKRAGLKGEQSSLFFDAIRLIKEMRSATAGKNPRFIIFENVCGVFSSDKGKDFQKILTEIVRIKEPTAPDVPLPEKGNWSTAGLLLGEKFSVAYRVFDAQFWGVAQRRRRVYLVADFAGQSAGKILFESKGLHGNFAESCGEGKNSAAGVENCVGKSSEKYFVLNDQGGRFDLTENKTATLRAYSNHPPCVYENHGQDSRYTDSGEISQTVSATFGMGGNNQPLVVDIRLTSEGTKNARSNIYETKISRCLDTGGNSPQSNQGGVAICESYGIGRDAFNQGKNAKFQPTIEKEIQPPLTARGAGAVSAGYSVRRLTPTECARLQGFPDWWCSNLETENPSEEEIIFWRKVFENVGKIKTDSQIRRWLKNPRSDSAEYKMWGNGIALPCAEFILKRIAKTA